MPSPPTLEVQEATFARAYAAGDIALAGHLYHPAVEYRSPTVRLFDWPRRIDGVERTLEFIALTIRGCRDVRYEAVESALVAGGEVAFVHVHFDWTHDERRLRSSYLVCYRYRDGLIGRQELYYDPGSPPQVVR